MLKEVKTKQIILLMFLTIFMNCSKNQKQKTYTCPDSVKNAIKSEIDYYPIKDVEKIIDNPEEAYKTCLPFLRKRFPYVKEWLFPVVYEEYYVIMGEENPYTVGYIKKKGRYLKFYTPK